MAARLRKGDTVVVISGKFKGQTGTISALLVEDDKVIVGGLNVVKRHLKPNPRNQQGGVISKEMPFHACKVMPVDPKTGKGTRVRFKTDESGNKVRIAVKSGEVIANAKPVKAE